MGNLNGFVKLHRKMIEWGWYSDCVVKDVFIHILMVATFKPTKYLGHDLKPGQAVIGRKKLAKELGFTEQQIRTALKKLESTGEISLFSTNKFTIATVENWEFYQSGDDEDNQQITNNQPTINQQITNNQPHLKNVKKDKNVKNVKKDIYIGVPDELKTAFMEFAEMREAKKKPIMTENTVTRILNRLEKFASSTDEKIAILNQSTDHCWIDVYDLKDKPKKGTGNPYLDMLGDECE